MVKAKHMSIDKKILIVEDEASIRKALTKKLMNEGAVVFEAGNGVDGLKVLKKEKIELILMDILMPLMDGVQMLKEMKKNRKYDKIKIIILTNLQEYNSDREVLEPHKDNYLIKSNYSLAQIVEKIKKMK
jgi:DNA-binding response OmpR family regulator